MFGNSLLTQVAAAGIAIGIIVMHIQPTLDEVKVLQDEILNTQEEKAKIEAVNDQLNKLYAEVNAMQAADKKALITYLPDTIDEVQVLKDLSLIARDSEVYVQAITYDGIKQSKAAPATDEEKPFVHTFSINMSSTYEQVKEFLLRLEQNNYPLTVYTMSVKPAEGGILDVSFELQTYSHKE